MAVATTTPDRACGFHKSGHAKGGVYGYAEAEGSPKRRRGIDMDQRSPSYPLALRAGGRRADRCEGDLAEEEAGEEVEEGRELVSPAGYPRAVAPAGFAKYIIP